jgi:hypothetical protein
LIIANSGIGGSAHHDLWIRKDALGTIALVDSSIADIRSDSVLLVVISHQTEKAQKLAKFDHDSANAVLIFRDQASSSGARRSRHCLWTFEKGVPQIGYRVQEQKVGD